MIAKVREEKKGEKFRTLEQGRMMRPLAMSRTVTAETRHCWGGCRAAVFVEL